MADERRLLFEIRHSVDDGFIRAHQEIDDDWEAIYEFANRGGALVLREMRVVPTGEHLPAILPRAARLRDLRPADVLAEARTVLLDNATPDVLEAFHGLKPERVAAKPRLRARRHSYFYAAIAAQVEAALLSGSVRPRVDAAEELGPGWDSRAVRDALTAAKSRGLWRSTSRGRRGGSLTDEGLAVLRDEVPEGYEGPVVGDGALGLIEAARSI